MVDGRRGRWISFDASFFDGPFGMMLMERFGPAGITLFMAFLCACKRNLVQGQIEYGSVPDALALMGVPTLELVDGSGRAWELQSFWRALAAHKQCSTSRRGRLVQVKSSNWSKWQEGYVRQTEAQRKSRPGGTNTPEDAPPKHGGSRAKRSLARGETETETETESKTPFAPAAADAGKPARPPDPLWDAMLAACGIHEPPTPSARGAYNRARSDLAAVSATPEEIHHRAGVFRRRWPDASLTPTALARRWSECAALPTPVANGANHRSTTVDRSHANILEALNDTRRGSEDPAGHDHRLAPARALEGGD